MNIHFDFILYAISLFVAVFYTDVSLFLIMLWKATDMHLSVSWLVYFGAILTVNRSCRNRFLKSCENAASSCVNVFFFPSFKIFITSRDECCEFLCLQEGSSEFEVVNMEEKAAPETQTVSLKDVRKSWACQRHVCELVCIFGWIIAPFQTFLILSFSSTEVSHVTDSSHCSHSAVSVRFLIRNLFIVMNQRIWMILFLGWLRGKLQDLLSKQIDRKLMRVCVSLWNASLVTKTFIHAFFKAGNICVAGFFFSVWYLTWSESVH